MMAIIILFSHSSCYFSVSEFGNSYANKFKGKQERTYDRR